MTIHKIIYGLKTFTKVKNQVSNKLQNFGFALQNFMFHVKIIPVGRLIKVKLF